MRIIDADALIKQIKSSSAYNDYEWAMYADGFIEDIENAPTIEPKRERCEYCKDGYFIGQRFMFGNDGKWHKICFCPNCGADMRGEDDE